MKHVNHKKSVGIKEWKTLIRGVSVTLDENFRREVGEYAARTSITAAGRKYGVNPMSARKWMHLLGYKSRRIGNYTNEEAMNIRLLTQ